MRDLATLARGGQHGEADLHRREAPFAGVDRGPALDHGGVKLVDHLVAVEPRWRHGLEPALVVGVDVHALRRRLQVGALARRDDEAEMLVEARAAARLCALGEPA